MSVLIKGMELPKNCSECWAIDDSGDYPCCRITEEQRGYNFRMREKRMDKCPLVEVPTPHGRLIDADELLRDSEGIILETIDDHEEVEEMIKDAPTVIEAEK